MLILVFQRFGHSRHPKSVCPFFVSIGFLRSKRQVYALSCCSVRSTSCARHATPLWVPRSPADARAALHGMPPWFWQALLRWEHGSQPPAEHRGPLKIKLEDSELGDGKLSLLPFLLFFIVSLDKITSVSILVLRMQFLGEQKPRSIQSSSQFSHSKHSFFGYWPEYDRLIICGEFSLDKTSVFWHFLVKDIGVFFGDSSAFVRHFGVGRSEEWWLTSLTVASLGGCSGHWGGGTGCWGNGLSRAHGSQIVEVSLLLGMLRRVVLDKLLHLCWCRNAGNGFQSEQLWKLEGVFFSIFFVWGEFVTKRCGKLHMAGWSGRDLTMRLPYRSTRGNPTSSAQHRIWQRDPCQRPRSCFPMGCGMRTNSFATTLWFDLGGWLSLWYGDCLICFWSEKVAAFHSCCRNCPEPTETSLNTTNLAAISLFLKLSMQQTQNHQCLRLGLGLICDFRCISLDFSGRNSMTFIWGFFIPQLPLWFHFHSHQENVEPFVNALLKLSGPCTECLVAFDTALQRWGAYDTFLELAKQHWHVEAW